MRNGYHISRGGYYTLGGEEGGYYTNGGEDVYSIITGLVMVVNFGNDSYAVHY